MNDQTSSKTVYIVDDEEVIATTLAMILRTRGIEVAHFTNPVDALKAAQAHAPNLLISDVMLPGMTGIDLALKVCELWPDCRILLLSGQATAIIDTLGRIHRAGHVFEVLAKPVHPLAVIDAMHRLLD